MFLDEKNVKDSRDICLFLHAPYPVTSILSLH